MMDFSGGAGQQTANTGEPIPDGQLAWAYLLVREIKASGSGGQYLDCELTLDEGQPYARRKIWEMIGDPNHAGNSEQYRQMGQVAIARILECGRGAGPHNPQGYGLNHYTELSGLRVAIKIGIEKGKNGYDDKNRVKEFLTPNPQSGTGHAGYAALQAGQFDAFVKKGGAGAFGQGQAPNGFGAAPAQQAQQPSMFGQPQAQGGQPGGQAGFGAANTAAPAAATNGSGSWGAQPQQGGQPAGQQGFHQPQQPAAGGWGAPNAASPSPGPTSPAASATTASSPSDPSQPAAWLQQAQGQ